MRNGFFLITGTSRGIGEALAKTLLEKEYIVLGVSRNQPDTLNSTKYYHLSLNLSEISRIGQIMIKVNEIVKNYNFDFVCLVNNASAIEPIGPIEKCAAIEIESHFDIGLIAPILLTSMFIQRFNEENIRKKVAFISSRAAFTPFAENSIYCSSKAGINMFSQCLGLEQKEKENGFEVISIGPGMVDTSMQLTFRSKTIEEFAKVDYFRQAFEDGKLQAPIKVAEKIYTILINKYEQGKYVSVSEV